MLSTWAGLPDRSPREKFGFQSVVSYVLIKCHQYWVGEGVVLWKNCPLGSRSSKKGYKADGTFCTGKLEDAKDRDNICGGPDLEKRGLPQLPVMAIWVLKG